MAVITRLGPDKPGPEIYAPPNRRAAPQQMGDVDRVASVNRRRSEADLLNGPAPKNLNVLIGRVAGASAEEIDRVILELQGLGDTLRRESKHVSYEIARYASLSQAAMTAMKVIADNLKQWKDSSDKST
jgi:hypothetical protein